MKPTDKGMSVLRIQNTRYSAVGQEKSIPDPASLRNISPWAICAGVLATGTSVRTMLSEKVSVQRSVGLATGCISPAPARTDRAKPARIRPGDALKITVLAVLILPQSDPPRNDGRARLADQLSKANPQLYRLRSPRSRSFGGVRTTRDGISRSGCFSSSRSFARSRPRS